MAQFLINAEIEAIKILAKFSEICKCECEGCEFSKYIGNSVCIPQLAERWVKYAKMEGKITDCRIAPVSQNTTPILKVYEKFKHLDKILLDSGFDDGGVQRKVQRECWVAIKEVLGHVE